MREHARCGAGRRWNLTEEGAMTTCRRSCLLRLQRCRVPMSHQESATMAD